MKIRDYVVVYLPIAVACAVVGISAVYTIEMILYQKILVWMFDGVILFTGCVISERIKELQRNRCKDISLEVKAMRSSHCTLVRGLFKLSAR